MNLQGQGSSTSASKHRLKWIDPCWWILGGPCTVGRWSWLRQPGTRRLPDFGMYSVRTFDTSGGAPKALAVSPDGSQVAVGVEGGYRVYAAFEGWSWREVETASAVVSLAFSWDGRLCYGTEDGVAIAGGAVVSRPKTRCVDWAPRCLLYTSPSPRDQRGSRMPSSA